MKLDLVVIILLIISLALSIFQSSSGSETYAPQPCSLGMDYLSTHQFKNSSGVCVTVLPGPDAGIALRLGQGANDCKLLTYAFDPDSYCSGYFIYAVDRFDEDARANPPYRFQLVQNNGKVQLQLQEMYYDKFAPPRVGRKFVLSSSPSSIAVNGFFSNAGNDQRDLIVVDGGRNAMYFANVWTTSNGLFIPPKAFTIFKSQQVFNGKTVTMISSVNYNGSVYQRIS
jgi:hypothetical protein